MKLKLYKSFAKTLIVFSYLNLITKNLIFKCKITRIGWVQNGGRYAKLHELLRLTISQNHSHSWERQQHFDFTDLIRLRWTMRWSIKRLATYCRCTKSAIDCALNDIRKSKKYAHLVNENVFRGS